MLVLFFIFFSERSVGEFWGKSWLFMEMELKRLGEIHGFEMVKVIFCTC